jgi:ATP-dependent DNA helicase RecG
MIDQEKISQFIADLPFILTKAQNKSIKEILSDLAYEKPMNRLLQGDVGSGKTVVAAIAMYVAYLNGLKSALMAPTEILALQHAKTIKSMLEPLGLRISTQTGSTKEKVDKPDILIGTHALLHQDMPKDLALLVVDEQHRFGVEQRAKLLKAKKTPHLLSMTATPIPRTVALTVYGELELSIIDEMPKGRKQIKTWVVPKKKRAGAYDWIEKQIRKDRIQAFVVCPLIEESESESTSEVKSAEQEYEYLKNEVYPKLKLGLLHGRMKARDKGDIVDKFRSKQVDVLVSTPVIEVGIDIPNATIMLIEGAERFGLAQLHQLRGRVGRGEKQSFCLLFTSTQYFEDMERLKAMETNDSGFKLAELDLELRGPGEMYGVKQHGFSKLRVAKFSDKSLIDKTNKMAKELIGDDPNLDNYPKLEAKLNSLLNRQVEPN